MPLPTAVRIRDVEFSYEDHAYRTPIKFGGVALDRATLLNVQVTVETAQGRRAVGFGSMPLGNVWAFPSRRLTYDQTLGAMKSLAQRLALAYSTCSLPGHPIEITHSLEPGFVALANQVAEEQRLGEPMPILSALVAASPFDAALHDGFGKVHGLSSYRTYGRDFLEPDLGHFLGTAFAGERLDRYIAPSPVPRLPLYHLVGALDPLEPEDVTRPAGDGLPETLGEWIRFNGLTHLKIKLNGDDLEWDLERVLRVDGVASATQRARGADQWRYSLDFNERCQHVSYLLEFLDRLKQACPQAFARIQYIEQPTARDLRSQRENAMHAAARLKPIVIDESLTDLESLLLARELGYTGAALKACKGQTQSLLLASAIQKLGLFVCVQDLTCPGASLIHSAGLAAHVPGVAAIEANARQYMPQANAPWEARWPGIFRITDGTVDTGVLTGPGLSAVP